MGLVVSGFIILPGSITLITPLALLVLRINAKLALSVADVSESCSPI